MNLKKKEIMYGILGVIGAAGIVVTAVALPGLLLAAAPFVKKKTYRYKTAYQAILRLDRKGWIVAKKHGDQWRIKLTAKGEQEWKWYELGTKHLQQPKTWDGRWHILAFDIPELKNLLRRKIRRLLHQLKFQRLQDSVWVYPFDCREVLELLRTKYKIRGEALYIAASHIDNDHWLKKHFSLPASSHRKRAR